LDVEKMHFHHQTKAEVEDITSARPVIRTFYDHTLPINDVDFHPTLPVIASASADCTVKFFDYTKASIKRSFKQIKDTHNVRSIHIHPSGDYMLLGTAHNQIRMYDLNNMQCYTSPNPQDHHFGPINQVRYSTDGKLFVSGSKDGSIKIWDGVTGRCVNTIPSAYSGQVYSVQFSMNSKYMLSNGQDYTAKLWDLSTGRQVRTYSASKKTMKTESAEQKPVRIQTCFNFNESSIVTSEGNDVIIWDTRQARVLHRLSGHNKNVRWVAPSPVEHAYMSCSEDQRARFWAAERLI
jgi:cleavage stimulation factor subunit 1